MHIIKYNANIELNYKTELIIIYKLYIIVIV